MSTSRSWRTKTSARGTPWVSTAPGRGRSSACPDCPLSAASATLRRVADPEMSPAQSDVRARRGRAGEDAAWSRYLELGYRLVARNWRCRLGEIDLLLARGRVLVVCEVKARRGAAFG